ncbi:MAG: hypothetical protein R2856_28520 [Caldilineaceae bacterium]
MSIKTVKFLYQLGWTPLKPCTTDGLGRQDQFVDGRTRATIG